MIRKNGFTFIEVMVTIVILTTGIFMIYKIFLSSLDQQSYLTHRFYASNLLDKKIFEAQRLFQEKGTFLPKEGLGEDVFIDNKKLAFEIKTLFQEIPGLEDLLQLDIGVFWLERGRPVRLTRSVYISRY